MAKVILFYSPFYQRSRDTESLMIAFRKQGHRVLSLSQESGKDLHEFLRPFGIETYTHVLAGKKNLWYFLRQLVFLLRFCRTHKPDVVFSHLESANLVASVGQYFIHARVLLCRHHVDEASLYGFDKSLSYKITYALAKEIIVVSERARLHMIEHEKIPASKIILINLAYDFELYERPHPESKQRLKKEYSADVLLITVCRLTKYKRPDVSIRTLKSLIDQGINAQLIILGKGEMVKMLEAQVRALNLTERVHFPGHVRNVLDYLSASDYLLHPSLLESSCVVIKEAGLVDKPVIACESVGDFDAYVVNNVNGFLVNRENFSESAASIILRTHSEKNKLEEMGQRLHDDIIRLFDVKNIIGEYNRFLNPRKNESIH